MTLCPRCCQPIQPQQPTDDDHYDIPATLGGTLTQPAHRHCNRAHGAHLGNAIRHNRHLTQAANLLGNPPPGRLVILLAGPPAAGKTSIARTLGLTLYDRDDPQWGSTNQAAETRFRRALTRLGRTPNAQAVIIRAAPTTRARADTITTAGVTHQWLVLTPPELSHQRITERARPDAHTSHRAVADWWTRHANDPDYNQDQPPLWTPDTMTQVKQLINTTRSPTPWPG